MNGRQKWFRSANRVLVLPALLLGSLFLPWIVVTGLVNREVAGTELVVEPVIILAGLAVAASWVYESGKYRVDGWIAGGVAVEGAILWTLWELNRGIEAQKDKLGGELLGDMIAFDAGLGMFLAATVAAVIIVVGVREYRTSSEGFAMPDVIGAVMQTD